MSGIEALLVILSAFNSAVLIFLLFERDLLHERINLLREHLRNSQQ